MISRELRRGDWGWKTFLPNQAKGMAFMLEQRIHAGVLWTGDAGVDKGEQKVYLK